MVASLVCKELGSHKRETAALAMGVTHPLQSVSPRHGQSKFDCPVATAKNRLATGRLRLGVPIDKDLCMKSVLEHDNRLVVIHDTQVIDRAFVNPYSYVAEETWDAFHRPLNTNYPSFTWFKDSIILAVVRVHFTALFDAL